MEFHKYTISKKGFWRKSFEIYENDRLLYQVKSPGWISYKQLLFIDANRKEALKIKRRFNLFQFSFEFFEHDKLKGTLTKSRMSNEYTLESIYATYIANGNWLGNEYTIYLGDEDIAKVSRKFFSNKKQYGLAIIDGHHNLFILGMVISIEVVKMVRKKRNG